MKNYFLSRAVGGIDPKLVESAERQTAPAKRGRRAVRIAVIATAATLAVFGLLAFNANVRAAVLGFFIRTDDEGYKRVHFDVTDSEGEAVDIRDVTLGYIPEGFVAHEVSELGEYYDARIRMIRLVRAEDAGLSEYEMANGLTPQIFMWISRAGEIDWGYSDGTYEMTYLSTINGMDAFMIDHAKEGAGSEGGGILFSDDKITVNIGGTGISLDEIIKVAESITW